MCSICVSPGEGLGNTALYKGIGDILVTVFQANVLGQVGAKLYRSLGLQEQDCIHL